MTSVDVAPIAGGAAAGGPQPRGARLRRRAARPLRAAPAGAAGGPPRARGGARARRDARLPRRDARDPRGRLARGRAAGGLPRPARRDHRADRPQAGHQRAQLGRARLHGRLRGRQHAHLGEPGRRSREPRSTRSRARSSTRAPRARSTRSSDDPATLLVRPRGWHLPEKHLQIDGEPVVRRAVRLRPARVPRRAPARRAGPRRLLLPAQARAPPRGAAVERRRSPSPRTRSASPRGTHARHGPDRDAARPRSRWTRSSTSCASTRSG